MITRNNQNIIIHTKKNMRWKNNMGRSSKMKSNHYKSNTNRNQYWALSAIRWLLRKQKKRRSNFMSRRRTGSNIHRKGSKLNSRSRSNILTLSNTNTITIIIIIIVVNHNMIHPWR